MCNLAATGSNDLVTVLLLVAAIVLVAVGAALMLKGRGTRGAVLALLLVVGGVGVGSVTGSAPAQAASCAPADVQGEGNDPGTSGDGQTPGISTIAVDSVSWVASGLSDSKTFTVTNTSATVGAANVLATIPGGDSTFSVTAITCPALLAPGFSCQIVISFATVSTSFGAFSSVASFAGNNTNTVAATLSGTGYTTLEISQSTDGVFGGGPASILTVTNAGTVDALDFEATIVIPPGSGFIVVTTQASDCSAVTSLAPGDNCTVEIAFSGSIGGDLTVTPTASNAPASSPATVHAYLG